jgi:hypothetical protein
VQIQLEFLLTRILVSDFVSDETREIPGARLLKVQRTCSEIRHRVAVGLDGVGWVVTAPPRNMRRESERVRVLDSVGGLSSLRNSRVPPYQRSVGERLLRSDSWSVARRACN